MEAGTPAAGERALRAKGRRQIQVLRQEWRGRGAQRGWGTESEKRVNWGQIDELGPPVFNAISASAGYTPSAYVFGPDSGPEQMRYLAEGKE